MAAKSRSSPPQTTFGSQKWSHCFGGTDFSVTPPPPPPPQTLLYGCAVMVVLLAWKIVAIALAKKVTLYAVGRVSCM